MIVNPQNKEMKLSSQPPEKNTPTLSKHDLNEMKKVECAMQILDRAEEYAEKEQIENIQNFSKDTETKETARKDRTEFTKTKEMESLEKKYLVQIWTQQQLKEKWEEILEWKPQGQSLDQNLQVIKKLYTEIAEQVKLLFPLENQEFIFAQLHEMVFAAMNQMMEEGLDKLFQFLSSYSQKEVIDILNGCIYHLATGEKIEEKDLNRYAAGRYKIDHQLIKQMKLDKSQMNSGFVLEKAEPKEKITKNNKEILSFRYTSSGSVEEEPVLSTIQKKTQSLFQKETVQIHSLQGKVLKNFVVNAKDIQKAADFVQHLNKAAMAFPLTHAISKNEILMGVLSGILGLKAEVFCSLSKIDPKMAEIMKSATNRFLFYYIQSADSMLKMNQTAPQHKVPLEQRIIFNIYEFILKTFQKTKDPAEAIKKGVEYALKQFYEKEKEMLSQKNYSQERKSAFFANLTEGKQTLSLKEGFAIIRSNWNTFIQEMNLGQRAKLNINNRWNLESIWGAVLKEEVFLENKKGGFSGIAFFVMAAIFLFAGGIASILGGGGGSLYFFAGSIFFTLVSLILKFL